MRLAVMLCAISACGRMEFEDTTRLATFSVRGDHVCALTATGLVACWGRGNVGELGTGDQPQGATVRIVESAGVADLVATGESTSCAVSGGDVQCWGDNGRGQVTLGAAGTVTSPVAVDAGGEVASVELGQNGSMAVMADGTVRYWGGNGCAQAGTGMRGSPQVPAVVPGVTGAVDLAISDVMSCALDGAGQVTCWGTMRAASPPDDNCTTEPALAPAPPPELAGKRIVEIDGGCHDHLCAVADDGTVWCKGSNVNGELGDGTTTYRDGFVQAVDLKDAVDVADGAFHTCALRRTGEVVCWGRNDRGQLGRGTVGGSSALTPGATLALPAPIDHLEAGCTMTCAQADDQLWCWGRNDWLQLGIPMVGDSAIPVEAWRGPRGGY
jgi:alpha-tubulin suppressor-like RCC1 family protein